MSEINPFIKLEILWSFAKFTFKDWPFDDVAALLSQNREAEALKIMQDFLNSKKPQKD